MNWDTIRLKNKVQKSERRKKWKYMYIHIVKIVYSDLLERYIIIKCGYLQEMGVIGRQVEEEGGPYCLSFIHGECILFVYRKHIEQFLKKFEDKIFYLKS